MADIIASQGATEKIRMGSRISLHFALLMPSGEEIDTTRRGQPAALTLGDGNLLPGFEEALIGLAAGDDAQLVIPADQAFGERVEANVRLLARSMFNDPFSAHLNGIDIAMEFRHNEPIKRAVARTVGIGCLSRRVLERELADATLIEINTPPPAKMARRFYLIRRHASQLPPAAMMFWQQCLAMQ